MCQNDVRNPETRLATLRSMALRDYLRAFMLHRTLPDDQVVQSQWKVAGQRYQWLMRENEEAHV